MQLRSLGPRIFVDFPENLRVKILGNNPVPIPCLTCLTH